MNNDCLDIEAEEGMNVNASTPEEMRNLPG
jgi:hypothetical protein